MEIQEKSQPEVVLVYGYMVNSGILNLAFFKTAKWKGNTFGFVEQSREKFLLKTNF